MASVIVGREVRVANLHDADRLWALAGFAVGADRVAGRAAGGSVPKSPRLFWSHYVSLAAWARMTSSSMPHLQAIHWMISSVVPVKLPVTRP